MIIEGNQEQASEGLHAWWQEQVAGKVGRRGTDLVLPKALQLKLLTVDLLRPPKQVLILMA